jgi:hypothetical protein
MNDEGRSEKRPAANPSHSDRNSGATSLSNRRELLERCGAAYGELHLAIAFTDGIRGEAAKQNTKGWKATEPLASAEQGQAIMGSALARNPVVCLRASGLIGIDIDGEHGRTLTKHLEVRLPRTVAVKTGDGGHLWFRSPENCPPDVVKVQLSDKLTTSADGYLVCPPARHPNGHTYLFIEGHEPWSIPIATLPLATTRLLAKEGRTSAARARAFSGPIEPGDRHEHLRRISYAMRRYSGASVEAIEAALLVENESRCSPPKAERLVRALAEYTYERVTPIGDDDE